MRAFQILVSAILFFVPLLVIGSASLDGPRVVVLTEKDAVIQEYCRVEAGTHFDNCGAPRDTGLAVVYLPLALGNAIASSVNESLRIGYAEDLSQFDLFHGHAVLKGPQTVYNGPQAFFDDIQFVLFHSAEYLHRWYKEAQLGLPIEKRTPRSYVGWPNGSMENARSLIQPGVVLKGFEGAGTIFIEELVESHVGSTQHKLSSHGGYEDLFIQVEEHQCKFGKMLLIFKEPNGRFHMPNGEAYEIFLHCSFPLP